MSKRFDVISPRPKKDGSTFWHRVGTAFEARSGGYQIILDSLPLPDAEGRVSMLMREPRQRDDRPRGDNRQQEPQQSPILDDETPF